MALMESSRQAGREAAHRDLIELSSLLNGSLPPYLSSRAVVQRLAHGAAVANSSTTLPSTEMRKGI